MDIYEVTITRKDSGATSKAPIAAKNPAHAALVVEALTKGWDEVFVTSIELKK